MLYNIKEFQEYLPSLLQMQYYYTVIQIMQGPLMKPYYAYKKPLFGLVKNQLFL